MKNQFKTTQTFIKPYHSRGMTLLDVLMAIVIFVVGMLALAALQGNLSRSSTDANVRTVATNVAEELVESLRTIAEIPTPTGTTCATDLVAMTNQNIYQCIADGSSTVARGGINFAVAADVDDYWLMPDGITVTDDPTDLPTGWSTDISSFKIIELSVNWGDQVVGFQDAPTDDQLLGSGAFTVSAIVPSIPNIGAAKVAAEDDGKTGTPPVDYTPGLRPDIVAIDLQGSKFKESTTPQPDVIRSDELTETWFDVITYNKSNTGSIFLRREEFLVVSCECTLKGADASNQGLLPTVWNGIEYSDERWATKAYGVSANNQQSQYCDTCCRDHHDPSNPVTDDDVYDPARFANPAKPVWSESGGLDGDHKHYTRANKGGLSVAGNNKTYVEACRMVRKDGFMRVAQDFRQEAFFAFPEGYLNTDAGVAEYSSYVTTSVDDFYGNNKNAYGGNGDFLADPSTTFPGGATDNPTALPLFGSDSQQIRSRGVYVDQLSTEAAALVQCMISNDDGDPADDTDGEYCGAPGVTHYYQLLPFFEVQTTWLSWWNMDDPAGPVSVTNEAVADGNAHSRGLTVLENMAANGQQVEVITDMRRGNTGLTVTDPITDTEQTNTSLGVDYTVYVDVNGGDDGTPPTPTTTSWSGTFGSSINKVDADSTTITPGGNTFCSRSSGELTCHTTLDNPGSITITGYATRANKNAPWDNLWICVSNFPDATVLNAPDGLNNSVTISWPANASASSVVLSIESNSCPTP